MVTALFAAVLFYEWARIGVVADPEVVKSYRFGSEAMLDAGGWRYATAQLYATTAPIQGLVAAGLGALFATAAVRRSAAMAVLAYCGLVIEFVANRVIP